MVVGSVGLHQTRSNPCARNSSLRCTHHGKAPFPYDDAKASSSASCCAAQRGGARLSRIADSSRERYLKSLNSQ
jgi:hypothetical protein